MKFRNGILLSLLVSNAALADNNSFTGLYGNVGVGYMQTALKDDYNTIIQVPGALDLLLTAVPSKVTDSALTGGIGVGYGWSFNDLYLVAIEARANFQNPNTIVDHQHIEVNSQFLAETNTSVKLDKDFALLAKLGLIFNPTVLLYGLVGVDWGDVDIASSAAYSQNIGIQLNGSVADSHSSYESALFLGIGFEYLLIECASIGLEYNYLDYGSLTFPGTISDVISLDGVPTAGTLLSDSNALKMKGNRVTFRVNYYYS